MSGVNKVIIVGNLGNDPDVKVAANGNTVTNISVATSEKWKDAQGQQQERTEWHKITFFGRLAEIAGEYLKKGSKVYVEGSLRTEKYSCKQTGTDKYSTGIIAKEMQMLDSRANDSFASPQSAPPAPMGILQDNNFDDSIPF